MIVDKLKCSQPNSAGSVDVLSVASLNLFEASMNSVILKTLFSEGHYDSEKDMFSVYFTALRIILKHSCTIFFESTYDTVFGVQMLNVKFSDS